MNIDGCIAGQVADMKTNSAATCDMACTVRFAKTIADGTSLSAPTAEEHPPLVGVTSSGRAAPPDRLPPRATFLL